MQIFVSIIVIMIKSALLIKKKNSKTKYDKFILELISGKNNSNEISITEIDL